MPYLTPDNQFHAEPAVIKSKNVSKMNCFLVLWNRSQTGIETIYQKRHAIKKTTQRFMKLFCMLKKCQF